MAPPFTKGASGVSGFQPNMLVQVGLQVSKELRRHKLPIGSDLGLAQVSSTPCQSSSLTRPPAIRIQVPCFELGAFCQHATANPPLEHNTDRWMRQEGHEANNREAGALPRVVTHVEKIMESAGKNKHVCWGCPGAHRGEDVSRHLDEYLG